MNKVQLTKEGQKKLQEEYAELKTVKRPAAVERLQKARAMGDLSENSEYAAAKDELAFVEGRIQEVDAVLKHAEVVENHINGHQIALGSHVSLEINGERDEFYIVGEFEADPMQKKLSHTSPLGKALLGKQTGDVVEVEVPAGKTTYKVLQIR